ncbi:hypothetical protein AA313_de0209943 [Arthrobotrys entomopaga]|nr:hypothetical protein AA313_de0209943 [Arthrobotrys entomopaga]
MEPLTAHESVDEFFEDVTTFGNEMRELWAHFSIRQQDLSIQKSSATELANSVAPLKAEIASGMLLGRPPTKFPQAGEWVNGLEKALTKLSEIELSMEMISMRIRNHEARKQELLSRIGSLYTMFLKAEYNAIGKESILVRTKFASEVCQWESKVKDISASVAAIKNYVYKKLGAIKAEIVGLRDWLKA